MKTYLLIVLFISLSFFASCGEKDEATKEIQKSETNEQITTTTTSTDTIKALPDSIVSIDASSNSETDVKIINAKPGDYSKKPIEGQIVSLRDIASGSSGKINKEQAKKLAEGGDIIVFKSGEFIYFVYNEDGTFAGKKLAGYANNQKVGMLGKSKVIGGFNIFICSLIEGM